MFIGGTPTELSQASAIEVSLTTRRFTRVRALITLGIFVSAAGVAYRHPLSGFGLVCCVLFIYLRPQVPGKALERHGVHTTFVLMSCTT
jgi:hypothetical protein